MTPTQAATIACALFLGSLVALFWPGVKTVEGEIKRSRLGFWMLFGSILTVGVFLLICPGCAKTPGKPPTHLLPPDKPPCQGPGLTPDPALEHGCRADTTG